MLQTDETYELMESELKVYSATGVEWQLITIYVNCIIHTCEPKTLIRTMTTVMPL